MTAQKGKDLLIKIADELLAREVLDADQVTRLAQGLPLDEFVPAVTATTPPAGDTPRREPNERPGIVPPPLVNPVAQE